MAKKNRTTGNKAGNTKRARGKSTMKDLELTTGKAKSVKGGVLVTLGVYSPILALKK